MLHSSPKCFNKMEGKCLQLVGEVTEDICPELTGSTGHLCQQVWNTSVLPETSTGHLYLSSRALPVTCVGVSPAHGFLIDRTSVWLCTLRVTVKKIGLQVYVL